MRLKIYLTTVRKRSNVLFTKGIGLQGEVNTDFKTTRGDNAYVLANATLAYIRLTSRVLLTYHTCREFKGGNAVNLRAYDCVPQPSPSIIAF
jgi:hypothetical protein